jgi:hypothetical protein
MGSYTINKAVGDNAFELNIPPFLGLHPVFNVDLLRPYFPPLLGHLRESRTTDTNKAKHRLHTTNI